MDFLLSKILYILLAKKAEILYKERKYQNKRKSIENEVI